MSNTLTLHLIQWRVIPGNVQSNLDRADQLINSARPERGDLILLPEMFPSGFYYTALDEMADEYERVVAWMGDTTSRHGAGIVGSLPVHRHDGIANTMILVDKNADAAAAYDKAHLFSLGDEDQHFTSGGHITVTQYNGIDAGLAICFDLRFPEMTRELCDRGSKLVLVSAQWPLARVDHFRDLIRVRAMENQLFVASCNSCGDDDKGLVLGGGSTVVGPSGEVKGVLGGDEGVLTVKIDILEVDRVRESFPVLKVRRKDLFEK